MKLRRNGSGRRLWFERGRREKSVSVEETFFSKVFFMASSRVLDLGFAQQFLPSHFARVSPVSVFYFFPS